MVAVGSWCGLNAVAKWKRNGQNQGRRNRSEIEE